MTSGRSSLSKRQVFISFSKEGRREGGSCRCGEVEKVDFEKEEFDAKRSAHKLQRSSWIIHRKMERRSHNPNMNCPGSKLPIPVGCVDKKSGSLTMPSMPSAHETSQNVTAASDESVLGWGGKCSRGKILHGGAALKPTIQIYKMHLIV
jgi:hypothetical protein